MAMRGPIIVGLLLWGGTALCAALLASDYGAPPDADAGVADAKSDDKPLAQVLASGERAPAYVATDDRWLYWLDAPYGSTEGSLHRSDKNGEHAIVLADHLTQPVDLAVDETGSYYVAGTEKGTGIEHVERDGSTRSWIVKDGTVCGVAVIHGDLYWTTGEGRIMHRSEERRPEVIASDQNYPCSITTDGARIYWANRGTGQPGEGSVVRIDIDGKNFTRIATEEYGPNAVRVSDEDVYWTTTDGLVKHVKTSGGRAEVVHLTKFSFISSIAVAGSRLYWTENGEIWSRSRTSAEEEAVVRDLKVARGLVIDEGFVYFTDFGTNTTADGRVMRIEKPE